MRINTEQLSHSFQMLPLFTTDDESTGLLLYLVRENDHV